MDKYQRYINKLNRLYNQLKNTTLSGLSDRVVSSENEILQLQTNYENLQSNYQELQTNYENLQSNCQELQEQLTNHINTPTE